jgi:hypothetical protein
MTEAELRAKIAELETAAEMLDGGAQAIALNKIDALKNELDGLALDALRARLQQMTLPDIQEMKAKIAAARKATETHNNRIKAINDVVAIISGVLKKVVV